MRWWLSLNGLDEAFVAALMNKYFMSGGQESTLSLRRSVAWPAYLTSNTCYEPEKWFVEREHYFRLVVAKISVSLSVG